MYPAYLVGEHNIWNCLFLYEANWSSLFQLLGYFYLYKTVHNTFSLSVITVEMYKGWKIINVIKVLYLMKFV